jgi:ADP-ribose pyrophosphatase YjhB (NUDIX family)
VSPRWSRGMREETGVDVEIGRLLCLCDHTAADVHDITFEVLRVGGTLGAVACGVDTRAIRGVEFVELEKLTGLGFGDRFVRLCRSGFPYAGSYMGGAKANIGL